MSQNSKAKRDKRKKQQPKRPIARLSPPPRITNHAVLQDADGRVVAAIGLQGDSEWLLSIGGQTMGSADNPIPMLAMLKHLADVQEAEGNTISLEYSFQLQQMIDAVAAEENQTGEEYLAKLVSEFQNADADEEGDGNTGDAAEHVRTEAIANDAIEDARTGAVEEHATAEDSTTGTDIRPAALETSDADNDSDNAAKKSKKA